MSPAIGRLAQNGVQENGRQDRLLVGRTFADRLLEEVVGRRSEAGQTFAAIGDRCVGIEDAVRPEPTPQPQGKMHLREFATDGTPVSAGQRSDELHVDGAAAAVRSAACQPPYGPSHRAQVDPAMASEAPILDRQHQHGEFGIKRYVRYLLNPGIERLQRSHEDQFLSKNNETRIVVRRAKNIMPSSASAVPIAESPGEVKAVFRLMK